MTQTPAPHDGYVKFSAAWTPGPAPDAVAAGALIDWRTRLFQERLIGMYENGIGYGNISIRLNGEGAFIITGTATGGIPQLTPEHLTTVTGVMFDMNQLSCTGPCSASSESMSHAMLYQCGANVQAVIHIHHRRLWEKLLYHVPTTPADVPYGTPEMASALRTLWHETDLTNTKVLVMAGHEEGIISFGSSLDEAGMILFSYVQKNLST